MRQNPIQRTVRSVHMCVCIALCSIVAHKTAQNRLDDFPSYPPDDHHCSDDVYLMEEVHGSPAIHTFTSHVDRVKPAVIYQLQCRVSPVIDRLHSLVTQVCKVQLVHG